MITLREGLSLVLYASVTDVNDLHTDEELIEQIVENMVVEKIANIDNLQDDIIVGYNEIKNSEKKDSKKELDGTWVYIEEHKNSWQLKRCSSIEEAINIACNYICDVRILHEGSLLDWDVIDSKKAFYVTDCNIQIIRL